MLYPKIDWKKFDKNNPPPDLDTETRCLIFLREKRNDKKQWNYWIDVAIPSTYTEGQNDIEVLA